MRDVRRTRAWTLDFAEALGEASQIIRVEPLILVVILVAAVPYMRFQWSLTQNRYGLERSRATKRRWTQYFVSSLTDSTSVPEAKILDLAPMMIRKFRALMSEFRDQDRGLLLRSTRAAGEDTS